MKKLDVEFIQECVDNGLTDQEIAVLLNCNRVSVTRSRKNNNIKKRKIENKRDKSFVCVKCNTRIYIKRKEAAKMFCDSCLKMLQ